MLDVGHGGERENRIVGVSGPGKSLINILFCGFQFVSVFSFAISGL